MPRWPASRVDPYAALKSHHSMGHSPRLSPNRFRREGLRLGIDSGGRATLAHRHATACNAIAACLDGRGTVPCSSHG